MNGEKADHRVFSLRTRTKANGPSTMIWTHLLNQDINRLELRFWLKKRQQWRDEKARRVRPFEWGESDHVLMRCTVSKWPYFNRELSILNPLFKGRFGSSSFVLWLILGAMPLRQRQKRSLSPPHHWFFVSLAAEFGCAFFPHRSGWYQVSLLKVGFDCGGPSAMPLNHYSHWLFVILKSNP